MNENLDYQQSIQAFKKFVSFRNKIALWLSAIVLVCYYAFVVSIGLFPDVLGYHLGPSFITLGIIVGIFLIILCIVVTGLYTFFANQYFDKKQEEILQSLEQSGALEDLKNGKKY
ncbi:DUF485 domain-containing protein [Helicobacter sp.]|uniref:DUF485 domain-containing protein n=1 Tax=Helicobacter sp. TaxID=218 RepID=UPI0025C54F42|nr:DUF485 domain-containing protein [Helicobacter sp.]MCI5969376.1 DUF485 domain-containing protein [Helicobacter sp.]MDY2585630.1 DUF485 domain-containing protein [Helicobacter sp.]